MDISTRVVRLQQVMSQFALTCPKDETLKLSSALNYPTAKKTVSDDASLLLFKDVCSHFNNSPEIAQFMGMLYLRMFKSDQATSRVLDAPNPNVTLSAVESTLRDLIPTTTGTAFVGKSKSQGKGKNLAGKDVSNKTCFRYGVKGHISTTCPAPHPVQNDGNAAQAGNKSSQQVSGYHIDSGASLHIFHISNNRSYFVNFSVANSNGTIHNLISVKKATALGD